MVVMMAKPMKRVQVERALRGVGCKPIGGSRRGPHEVWGCPCGQHIAPLPRHKEISPGVVSQMIRQLACLEEGWLQ